MNNDNLPLYSAFIAVARAGSILKASELLYISQPAVTKSIKKLEQNLNSTLFTRNSRGVHLTEEGEQLYSKISAAFEYIEAGEDILASRRNLDIGHIKIGVSTTLCKYVLLPFLSVYTTSHPHINISIECQSSKATMALLKDHSIDIGIISVPSKPDYLALHLLGYVHDAFMGTPAYIGGMKDRHTKSNLLLLDRDNLTRQYVENYAPATLFSENNILEIDNMNLLIDFTKAGIGIGCAIREFVKSELQSGLLVEYSENIPSMKQRPVYLATPIDRKLTSHSESFVKFVKENIRNNELNILG